MISNRSSSPSDRATLPVEARRSPTNGRRDASRQPWLAGGLTIALFAAGCGAHATTAARTLPSTELDPASAEPEASDRPEVGVPTAVRLRGPAELARDVVIAFLESLLRADALAMEGVLTPDVESATAFGRGASRARAVAVREALAASTRAGLDAFSVDELVRVAEISVRRMAAPTPGPTEAVSLFRVAVPLTLRGRQMLGSVLGWSVAGTLWVHVGEDARVAAF